MEKNGRRSNQPITKKHRDEGKDYYKQTLRKRKIATPIISLRDFVKRYKRIDPDISTKIYGGSFIPMVEHNCNGNSLYLATILLFGEFDYIEGVLVDLIKDTVFHHAWLYSKSLKCYVDPTLEPEKAMKYYISDKVSYKNIPSFISFDRLENIMDPQWLNQGVKTHAGIISKRIK